MNIQQINLGLYPNDGTGDDLRTAFEKVISNFTEIDNNVVLSAENLGTGSVLVLETPVNNKLQFKTIKSGNDNLAISSDSTEIILSVADIFLDEILNVQAPNPTVGDTLIWNGTNWVNDTPELTGVTKIIAGNNVTISPESGEGEVTINSTSSGGGVPEGFDFGQITNPNNILELLIQATPINFGTITIPSSLYLDLGFIDTSGNPVYSLSSNVSQVLEGGSFTIILGASNVANGTLIPYTITGVTTGDINNLSLTGNFVVANSIATLTIQTTVDGLTEGVEAFTLTLNGITPSVSISVDIVESVQPVVDGGSPGTITFTSVSNGGIPTDTIFEEFLDGGGVVFVSFTDASVNGGSPSDTDFSTIIDGETPSAPSLVILDGGIVT